MVNITPQNVSFNPEKVGASCDTAELVCRWPMRGMRRLLEEAQQDEIVTRKVEDKKSGMYLGTIFAVNRPKLEVLPAMDWLVANVPFCYRHRFDIAYDFVSQDQDAALAFLDKHGELKWAARTARKVEYGTTIYLASERPREAALYPKWEDTVRLELRFTGRALHRTFKWFGAKKFGDLPRLNPRNLLRHHFKLLAFKDSYVTKAVRDAVRDDIEAHLGRGSCSEFEDRYRARIQGRVRGIFRHSDVFGFKRHAYKSVSDRALEALDMDWLKLVPARLKWPGLEGRVIENKRKCLENTMDWDLV